MYIKISLFYYIYIYRIDNTTFSNSHSDYGYLFDIKNKLIGYNINITNTIFDSNYIK